MLSAALWLRLIDILWMTQCAEVACVDGFFDMTTTVTEGGLFNFSKLAADWQCVGEAEEKAFKGLFGWCGFGGSLSLVDPARKATFMYVMTGMQTLQQPADPRHVAILEAYQACMARAE